MTHKKRLRQWWEEGRWVWKGEGWLHSFINIGISLSVGWNKSMILHLVFGSLSGQGWGRGEEGLHFLPVAGGMCKTTAFGVNKPTLPPPPSPECWQAPGNLHSKHIIKTLGEIIKIMILKRKIIVETKPSPRAEASTSRDVVGMLGRNLISMNFIVSVTRAWITLLRPFSSF